MTAEPLGTLLLTLRQLHPDGNVFSIFVKGDERGREITTGGYFNDHSAAAKALLENDGKGNLYVSLNPCIPTILARANNRIKYGEGKPSDKDIAAQTNFYIDCDVVRPAKTCATDKQHNEALTKVQEIRERLAMLGWPQPVLQGDSGNGGSLIYRINLHPTPDTKALLGKCLRALNKEYGTPTVKIDEVVCDPSRITRALGSLNMKGDEVPEQGIRHRRSRIIAYDPNPSPVPLELLQAFAAEEEIDTGSSGHTIKAKFDVRRYLDHHGRELLREKQLDGGSTIYVLRECIFDPSHAPGESGIVQHPDGKMTYQCFHDSCKGRTWKEARKIISGDDRLSDFVASDGSGQPEQKAPTKSEALLALCDDLQLFHDQHREGFTFLMNEVVSLKSDRFKQWLGHVFYRQKGKAANSDSLNQVLTVLKGKALFECPEIALHNRIAAFEGAFWYDLGDGRAVRITADGWQIQDAPILFRRYSHQQNQVDPKKAGDPWKLFRFLNVDKEHHLIVLVYAITCLVPDIPHPIFHPHGDQGAGKTTMCRVIKRLCDPSTLETLITPRDYAQLVQVIAHHHVCLFDNMSDVPGWMSDILAQACTGGGFSKRQLYTDDDDVIYQVKRCIGLNGINLLLSKPDVMDRSILLHLDRIEPDNRVEEERFWSEFEAARPEIFGAMLDVLADAMKLYPSVRLQRLPRMADFAKWGFAVTKALGRDGEEFIEAYLGNMEQQTEEVIQANTLAQAVLTLMDTHDVWEGTVKSTYESLYEIAKPQEKDPTFPKSVQKLRRHMERLKPTLMELGITFRIGSREERTEHGFPMTIQKMPQTCSEGAFDTDSNQFKWLEPEHVAVHPEHNILAAALCASTNPLNDQTSVHPEHNVLENGVFGEAMEVVKLRPGQTAEKVGRL